MSGLGEKTLMLLLTDTESLQAVVKDGMQTVVVPTPQFRPLLDWARAYYATNDKAPSIAIMRERWGDTLNDHNILDLDEDVEETIDWAIEDLKQTYVQQQVGLFSRRLATEVATAAPEDRLDALAEKSSELSGLVFDLQPRSTGVDLRASGGDLLAEYEMASHSDGVRGMCLGIEPIDNYLGGVWEGELVTVAGFPGSGKSFFADFVAHNEWNKGRVVTLFTLENSILMTQMRLACMALGFDIGELQTGTMSAEDEDELRTWCNERLTSSDTPLHILSPEMVNANPHSLVQAARAYGTDSLIIDQLSHVAAVPGKRDDGRRNEVSHILRTISDLIRSGRNPMPCLMMHQVNREGIKAVVTTNRVHMTHMAEASEVERTSALVMALYASPDNRNASEMQLQMIKQRRVRPQDWVLDWEPYCGKISYLRDQEHPDSHRPNPAQEAHRPSEEESEGFVVQ